MGFVRKRPVTTAAYDPALRMQARLWGLFFYLIRPVLPCGGRGLRRAVPAPLDGQLHLLRTGDRRRANGIRVAYAGGGTFSFGFLLINDGAVPLTINKVQVTGPNELLVPLKVELAAKRDAGAIGVGDPALERFLPFSLGAGDRKWIVVRTQFGNCARFAQRTFETYTQFLVTFKVGPFTKHAWVPLPHNIRVDSPPDWACPARGA